MLETPDIVLRTAAVLVALLLAALLLTASDRRPAALPGGLFSLAVAAFFVTSAPGAMAALGFWGYPLVALCVTKAVWFWLFSRGLFDDGARVERRHLLLAGAVAVVGTWQQTVFLERHVAGLAGTPETLLGLGFDAALLVFVMLGLHEVWRDLADDLVERRRRLRFAFLVAIGAYLALALGVQIWNLVNVVSTPLPVTRANIVLVAVVFAAAGWSLVQLRGRSWLDTVPKSSKPSLSAVEAALLVQLRRSLEQDRIYLREGLTIGALARHLGTGEHVLRRVINEGMGHRNFNDFLHAWRIDEACQELARPEQARLPVLTIAMKVGYGSVGAFNRAFKARVGMTPTAFRRHAADDAHPAR